MDKFQYAPGRPGFGTRGDDGSAGLPGLSIYFTDYNAVDSAYSISSAIINNTLLNSSTGYISEPLPEGRTYSIGDLIIDIEGNVYQITDPCTGTFEYKYTSLNTAGYFTSAEVTTDTFNFKRFFNNNSTPKYIIDNVYSDGEVNYYSTPSLIYGIEPRNFARIEFSNVIRNAYNPFTVYSSGESDEQSLAIVRETSANVFHIGNLDNNGNLRNTNMMFDVSSLRVNKNETGSLFTPTTTTGTIITNYEMNANSLFDGNFDISPNSFYITTFSNSATVYWNKQDFTNDQDVYMDLHFYKDVSIGSSPINMTTNASDYKTTIFHNCNNSGPVTISGLTPSTTYKCYASFNKNGWTRISDIKTPVTGEIPYMTVITPASKTIIAEASAWFPAQSSYIYTVELSTNSASGWNLTTYTQDVSWIKVNPVSASSGVYTFDVSVFRSAYSTTRYGTIYINSTADQESISVIQSGTYIGEPDASALESEYITLTIDGSLDVSLGAATLIDISVYLQAYAVAYGPDSDPDGPYSTFAEVGIRSETPTYIASEVANAAANGDHLVNEEVTYNIQNICASTLLYISDGKVSNGGLGDYSPGGGPIPDLYAAARVYIFSAKYHGTDIDVSIHYNDWQNNNQDSTDNLQLSQITLPPPIL